MNVPFLDLKAQYAEIKDDVLDALHNICENTAFAMGPAVKDFESKFAEFTNSKYAVGLNSGTSADQIAIQALIKPGDEVITTANTFIATSEAITAAGGKVVFVDIEEESFNMDPQKLEAAITPKTKVIVPVHLYGQPADMDPINEIAKAHDLLVVEDAAQAHGAEYKGRRCGSLADAAAFSFYPGKNLGAYGEAGAITTDKEEIADFARIFRDHGMREKYVHEIEGHNMRMEGFQGAVLGVKMKYIDTWTEARRRNAKIYDNLFADMTGVKAPKEMSYAKHVWHLYVLRVQNREGLQHFLSEQGIASGFHYKYPLHLQKAYAHLGYQKGAFPVTEKVMEEIISIPMYPELSEDQMNYVAETVRKFVEKG